MGESQEDLKKNIKKNNLDKQELNKQDRKNSPFDLYKLAGWDLQTTNLLDRYLMELGLTPSSRTLLNSMVKFEDMYPPVWSNPYSWRALFGEDAGENEYRSVRRAKLSLLKKDLLKAVDEHGGKRLILTTRGRRLFYKDYPLAKLRRERWDGFWTVVMYDFPERRKNLRNYLRKKLKGLGFGCPQESVLISPLSLAAPIRELIEGERLEDFAWVLSARRVLGLTNREVAQRAWDLGLLGGLYQKLLEVLPAVKKEKEKEILYQWQRCFLALDLADPYLPRELLPDDWPGEECRKEFSSLGLYGLLRNIFL